MTPFKQVSLDHLKSSFTPHPEVPRGRSPFSTHVYLWRSGRENGVITCKGRVMAFVMRELPDEIPQDAIGECAFNKSNVTASKLTDWQQYDAVKCTVNTRFAFWIINPKHQDLLPLPVVDFDGGDVA